MSEVSERLDAIGKDIMVRADLLVDISSFLGPKFAQSAQDWKDMLIHVIHLQNNPGLHNDLTSSYQEYIFLDKQVQKLDADLQRVVNLIAKRGCSSEQIDLYQKRLVDLFADAPIRNVK